MLIPRAIQTTYRVGHIACGVGAGAKGFNDARPRVGNMEARFECAGGIDVDAAAIRNFERLTGVPGTVMDLFDRAQYTAFHGKEPPAGWREATPLDIRNAFGGPAKRLDVCFASLPCKGFSGLLSAAASGTDKYLALNNLTLRSVWLMCEAYKDDPVRVFLFENVPRIATRGRWLLDQIKAILRSYGYVVVESTHDCGELGGLAQSRKRFLLVARRIESVPNYVYEPVKHRLRGVGEVIGMLPLPGDPVAGVMHRVPLLQWKTWVRLAFVPAGRDWRALNELAVHDGVLRDYGIVPEPPLRENALGVMGWDETAGVVTSARAPGQGRFSVADPRAADADWNSDVLGVRNWRDTTGVVAGRSSPSNGAYSVADPRPTQRNQTFAQYGVKTWAETAGVVTGQASPGGGPNSIADPRLGRTAFSNIYRVIAYGDAAHSVTSSREAAVADPRPIDRHDYAGSKYRVTPYDGVSRTVIAASTTGDGAFAVADPRTTHGTGAHTNKMRVVHADGPATTVTGSDRVGSGALSVADPRPVGLNAEAREHYATQGHYGVQPWGEPSGAVPAYAKADRGKWSVADPRAMPPEPMSSLPAPNDRLVARIIAPDQTWHRPFTTLELAALQSIIDPEEVFGRDQDGVWRMFGDFDLVGKSDAQKREWIGNAVPPAAARGMATTIGETLLLADMGETFTLSSRAIWVKPLAIALAVDPRQEIMGEML